MGEAGDEGLLDVHGEATAEGHEERLRLDAALLQIDLARGSSLRSLDYRDRAVIVSTGLQGRDSGVVLPLEAIALEAIAIDFCLLSRRSATERRIVTRKYLQTVDEAGGKPW